MMIIKFNWQSIYQKISDSMQISIDGMKLERGRDYDITGFSHTSENSDDRRVIISCRGKGNYTGDFEVVYKLFEHGGNVYYKAGGAQDKANGAFPERIKVGGKMYNMRRGEWERSKSGGIKLGHCEPYEQEIFVSSVANDIAETKILFHELVHAIIFEFCEDIGLSEEQNELFTDKFSRGLYQVIKDNPQIFESIS